MTKTEKPAYLIICMTHIEGTVLNPEYGERASVPALRYGHQRVGRGHIGDNVQLLEGSLPNEADVVLIESFPSMEALRNFWFSEEYQNAIPLRQNSIKIHFVLAVEGISDTLTS